MKKIVSLILVFVLIFSIPVSVLAETKTCSCEHTPVVYVPGFGTPIDKLNEDGSREEVFVFTEDLIKGMVDDIVLAVFGLCFGNPNLFTPAVENVISDMLGSLQCTYAGDPLYTIVAREYDSPFVDTHKSFTREATTVEREDAQYCFVYNWVEDPLTNADKLNDYIEAVKETTGHDKVVIKCHSEGNNVTTAYLYKYGNVSVEKLCYEAAAVNGIDLVGQLFTFDISLKDKGSEIAGFVSSLMQADENGELISALMGVLDDIGLLDMLCNLLDEAIVEKLLPDIYEKVFTESIVTMPALWSFIPDKYYEKSKDTMLGDNEKYDLLVKRIDEYHYNVMNKASDILKKAKADGVDIVIISQYGFSQIPVFDNAVKQSDMLIETEYTSFGATVSEFGKTLSLDFNNKNAKYYSKDLMVDASTCLFPEYTWFVRENNHAELNYAYTDLADSLILFDGQPTVSATDTPNQFMYRINNDAGMSEFVPVTEKIKTDDTNNFIKLIKLLVK